MWITGSAILLLILLAWFAVSLGQKMGTKMREGMVVAQHNADSTQKAQDSLRTANYATILSVSSADSTYPDIQNRVKRLRQNSESIREMLVMTRDSFAAFLPDSSTLTMLNKTWSQKYFINTGRAKRIKYSIETYAKNVNNDMPEEMERDSLGFFAVTSMMQNAAPDMLRNLLSWEHMMFDQPPTSVYTNLKIISRDIDNFENSVLEKYLAIPVPTSTPTDSAGGI